MLSFTRLRRENAWGVRGPIGEVKAAIAAGGDATITKKDGSQTSVRLARILKEFDDGNCICAIVPQSKGGGSRSKEPSASSGQCDECGRRASRLTECRDSSGIPGMCCPVCASMSREERSFG